MEALREVHPDLYLVLPEGNGWAIWLEGRGLVERIYRKEAAVEAAVRRAKAAGSSRLVIQARDGSVESEHNFPTAVDRAVTHL